MKELQTLLSETNLYLDNQGVQLEVPLTHVGGLYQVSDTMLGMTQAVGRIEELDRDYQEKKVGIGSVAPEMSGFSGLLQDVQSAASKITAIQSQHKSTMHAMTWLCFHHIINQFPGESTHFRGGIFRIQITAKTATFQILFLVGHHIYAPSHEIDLSKIVDSGSEIFRGQPFSQIPPNLLIPASDNSGKSVPVSYQGWKDMINNVPLNSQKKPVQMYRSYTADVLNDFEDMVGELLAA